MEALDTGFVSRVRETSLGLSACGLLIILSRGMPWSSALSYAAGVGIAMLVWISAETVGRRIGADDVTPREWLRCGAWYLGKYVVAALALYLLRAIDGLDPICFTGGFAIPGITVMLKAVGWMLLPADADPAAVYSRHRWERRVG